MDRRADRGQADQAEVDEDLGEVARLQEIARVKRTHWEAAATEETTAEQREALLAEVLSSTLALVNHEAGIPLRRREAHGREVAYRWRRLIRPGVVVLLVTAVGTVIAPWVSAWWAILPVVVGSGCALMLDGTEQVAREVDAGVARLVEVLVVVAVVVGTATVVLVPLVPALVLIVGSVVATLAALGVAAVAANGPTTPVEEGP